MMHILSRKDGSFVFPVPSQFVGLDDVLYPDTILATASAAELRAIGVFEMVPAEIPDGRIVTARTYEKRSLKVHEVLTLADAPIAVPAEVTRRQAKIVLFRAGLLSQADEAIAAMTGQAGEEARIDWADASVFRRDNPLIAGLGAALGLSAGAIDALFVEAAKVP